MGTVYPEKEKAKPGKEGYKTPAALGFLQKRTSPRFCLTHHVGVVYANKRNNYSPYKPEQDKMYIFRPFSL